MADGKVRVIETPGDDSPADLMTKLLKFEEIRRRLESLAISIRVSAGLGVSSDSGTLEICCVEILAGQSCFSGNAYAQPLMVPKRVSLFFLWQGDGSSSSSSTTRGSGTMGVKVGLR